MGRIVKRFPVGGKVEEYLADVDACWREADAFPRPFDGTAHLTEGPGEGCWTRLYPSGALVEGNRETVVVSHAGLVGPYLVSVELQGEECISEGSVGPFEHREEAWAFAEETFALWRATARGPARVVPNGIRLERMIRPADLPDLLRRCARRGR